jgi:hypothetical protein
MPKYLQKDSMSTELTIKAPQFYWENRHSALAVADSRESLMQWWKESKLQAPFDQCVADRLDDTPNRMIVRVRLDCINEGITIQKVFNQACLQCKGIPPKHLKEWLLQTPESVHPIWDKSYKILRLISDTGAYGDVFLAQDLQIQQKVAIKILHTEDDEEHMQLRKLQNLGPHPHIVQYIASAMHMDKRWIVMEYIEGVTYGKYEKNNEWTQELEDQYQSALAFMVQAGVNTERENEQENVLVAMVDGKPCVKLIDFGTLARA